MATEQYKLKTEKKILTEEDVQRIISSTLINYPSSVAFRGNLISTNADIKGDVSMTGGSIEIGPDAWHVDTSGNMWWGNFDTFASAFVKISAAGAFVGASMQAITIRTAASGSSRIELSGSDGKINFYRDAVRFGWIGSTSVDEHMLRFENPAASNVSPVFITSAGDSNVMELINTRSNVSSPVLRITTNADSGTGGLFIDSTGAGYGASLSANSNASENTTGASLLLTQSGTTSIIATNVSGCYLTKGGTWTDASSKKMKENFKEIRVLDKIMSLDIKKYNYISEDKSKKHISPMAEDMYEMFGVGDGVGLAAKDIAGIALQAIKELNKKVELLEQKLNK